MRLIMSTINHENADIETREKFSFDKETVNDFYKYIKNYTDIEGSIIISTCNRTEFVISCKENIDSQINPFSILCDYFDYDYFYYKNIGLEKLITNNEVLIHLCELSSGAKSLIWGEDQIIGQVKEAVDTARKSGALDSILEVVFRTAISSAKKVKSSLKLNYVENSIAYKVINQIKKYDNINKILVIGNGEIGQLVTKLMVDNGYKTIMTLRQYKNKLNIVPEGALTIEYKDRYFIMDSIDAVISATRSPHLTIDYDLLKLCNKTPKMFFDLAMPRDIDKRIENLSHVKYFNIDDLGSLENIKNREDQLQKIDIIINKYIDDFYDWYSYRERLAVR